MHQRLVQWELAITSQKKQQQHNILLYHHAVSKGTASHSFSHLFHPGLQYRQLALLNLKNTLFENIKHTNKVKDGFFFHI